MTDPRDIAEGLTEAQRKALLSIELSVFGSCNANSPRAIEDVAAGVRLMRTQIQNMREAAWCGIGAGREWVREDECRAVAAELEE